MKLRKFYGNQYVQVMAFLKKYVGIPFIALLILTQAQLIIAAWAIEAKSIVTEVWANMDNTAYERTLVVEVESSEEPAVIMERIAKCESGGTHYRKDGTLIKNVNNNGTIDFGNFRSVLHGKQIRFIGNEHLSSGRKQSLRLLAFRERSTEDWYSSKHYWAK